MQKVSQCKGGEFAAIYHGEVADIYHAHQLVWSLANRPNGQNRDFLFRYADLGDKTLFHIRDTSTAMDFKTGQVLSFSLDAAPSVRSRFNRPDGKTVSSYSSINGYQEAMAWLDKQGRKCGFQVIGAQGLKKGNAVVRKASKSGIASVFGTVLWSFDGDLMVTDDLLFSDAMRSGVGRMKAFGQGMLIVSNKQNQSGGESL